jgi:hypothetical protein
MGTQYRLNGVTSPVRTIAERVAYERGPEERLDIVSHIKRANAYQVTWGGAGATWVGEAYFPTQKDAVGFYTDTAGLPYTEYGHRVPLFFGITEQKLVDLAAYPCGQVDRELCSGPWATWKKKNGDLPNPQDLLRWKPENRTVRKRRVAVRAGFTKTDTLSEVQGGGYQVVWHENFGEITRELYFPTLALAQKFWKHRIWGEWPEVWFSQYEGINRFWYETWATKGCGGDASWVCAGSWGKVNRAGGAALGGLGAVPTDIRRIQALWMTAFGYDVDTGHRVSESAITVLGGGKFFVPSHGAVLILTRPEAAKLRLSSRLASAERVVAQEPYHPEMYVFKASGR